VEYKLKIEKGTRHESGMGIIWKEEGDRRGGQDRVIGPVHVKVHYIHVQKCHDEGWAQ
jgi:hypothetical protein